jgi:hypothetical protein
VIQRSLVTALVAFAALLPAAVFAQTVPQAPNKTFVSIEESVLQTTQYYDDTGVRTDNGCPFQKNATTLYAEHGFDAKDTGSVQIEYDHLRCNSATTDGLYDVQLGWLHELTHSDTTHFSWEAYALVPTGYSIGANPRIGYDRPGAQYGYAYAGSFATPGGYGFYSLQAGVRGYTSYPAPQLRTFGQVGGDITSTIQLIGQIEWDQALGAGHTLLNEGLNPFIFPAYSDGQAFGLIRFKINSHLSLVGQTSLVFYGRNYGIGPTNAVSLWSSF